jgi:hypothetical protein
MTPRVRLSPIHGLVIAMDGVVTKMPRTIRLQKQNARCADFLEDDFRNRMEPQR